MTQDEFKQLAVGDRLRYPGLGTFTIVEVERDYNYSSDPPTTFTDAFTATSERTGRRHRMKIHDRDVHRLEKLED